MKFIRVHVLQMDKTHIGYIDAEKITSMQTISMVVAAKEVEEGQPPVEPETALVTIINVAGQQPMFVKESPRMILTQIKKED